MDCSMPGFPVFHHPPEFAQTQVHWVDDAIQPSHPLSSPSPPAFNLSQHQSLFQWLGSSHQVSKVLQLQHQSFQWIDWFDLLVVQGTLKSLLQQHSLKASTFHQSFFMFPLSHWCTTTRETRGLTTRTFVSEVTSPSPDYLSFISNHYIDATNPYFVYLNRWSN